MKTFNIEVKYENETIEKDIVTIQVNDDVCASDVATWMLDAKESEFGENEKVVAEDVLNILVDKGLIRSWQYFEPDCLETVIL